MGQSSIILLLTAVCSMALELLQGLQTHAPNLRMHKSKMRNGHRMIPLEIKSDEIALSLTLLLLQKPMDSANIILITCG